MNRTDGYEGYREFVLARGAGGVDAGCPRQGGVAVATVGRRELASGYQEKERTGTDLAAALARLPKLRRILSHSDLGVPHAPAR
jgi:hypothetical protein